MTDPFLWQRYLNCGIPEDDYTHLLLSFSVFLLHNGLEGCGGCILGQSSLAVCAMFFLDSLEVKRKIYTLL